MQHVNDDMDEFFRRAGKEYSLNTEGADWEKIAKELNIAEQADAVSKKDNRKLLWLLLLLPFSIICTQYFADDQNSKVAVDEAVEFSTGKSVFQEDQPGQNKKAFVQQETNSNNKPFENEAAGLLNKKNSKTPGGDGKIVFIRNHQVATTRPTKNPVSNELNNDLTLPQDDVSVKRHRQFSLSTNQYSIALKLPGFALHDAVVDAIVTRKQDRHRKDKKFYAGIMGGIDATSIKFQKVETAGYDLGLLLGYSVNGKWSVETGIFNSKKFYYSKGEYFNTSKIYVPSNSKISSVDGNCTMWEVPLTVRYNIRASAKHAWFVTGGASSYFMNKENYNYVYYYPATGQSYERERYYNNSSRHFLAVAQFSGGYTHQVGKIGELRIEPYVKIPLRGVGVGSMPLHSVGIHLGMTRKLF